MSEPGPAAAGPAVPVDDPRLAALRQRGAPHFDAVRFRYIEALARRAAAQPAEVQRRLQPQLDQALADCAARCDRARAEAEQSLAQLTALHPQAAAPLKRLFAQGDFNGLQRLAAQLARPPTRGPLGQLVDALDRPGTAPAPAGGTAGQTNSAPSGELKALRQFRATWRRLDTDRQLARSLAQAPLNPGPLNSHGLVLRALQLMQRLSPAYLNHFMAHVEALLWLDQANAGTALAAAGKPTRRDGDKPRKPSRAKPAPPSPPGG